MNLNAPKARIRIGPQAPNRWRSNGYLPRCRCASGAHVRTQYAPRRFSLRLASGAFLNGPRGPITQTPL